MPRDINANRKKLKKLITLALLTAIAFVSTAVVRIPVVSFLKYDPKDAVIALAGFIYGPLEAVGVTVAAAVIEFLTVSETGLWGLLMNIIASLSLILPAVWIYRRHRTFGGVVLGLAAGSLLTVAMMLLWNYLVTPIYLGYPRAAVADMLLPVFLPFNLLKCTLNSILTVLLYKPVSRALFSTGLLEKPKGNTGGKSNRLILPLTLVALALAIAVMVLFRILSQTG